MPISRRSVGIRSIAYSQKVDLVHFDLRQVSIFEDQTHHMDDPVPFLTFQGDAKPAIEFYESIFSEFQVENIQYHEQENMIGKVMLATIKIGKQAFKVSDSPAVHDWDFSPAISFYIECSTEEEIKDLTDKLADGGKLHMPLANYGFSTLFSWVQDKFGINWQFSFSE